MPQDTELTLDEEPSEIELDLVSCWWKCILLQWSLRRLKWRVCPSRNASSNMTRRATRTVIRSSRPQFNCAHRRPLLLLTLLSSKLRAQSDDRPRTQTGPSRRHSQQGGRGVDPDWASHRQGRRTRQNCRKNETCPNRNWIWKSGSFFYLIWRFTTGPH